ncbi:hypothetical protein QAD02_013014 [Eretmocerus hayati]|uniref:Uncharacterized protein n=1 Tax=Eretmocerus hayati TaxID=131215 RepID=A0ACC2P1I7_9HYME|nr:hypothetical protein QAD02_013014 [Eretmocerus hayati]
MNVVESSGHASNPEGVLADSSTCTEGVTVSESKEDDGQVKAKGKIRGADSDTYVVRQSKKFKAMPNFSETQLADMLQFRNKLSTSGLLKETLGRHSGILVKEFSKVSDYDRQIYKFILDNQSSNLLEAVKLFKVKPLDACCECVMGKLLKDALLICEKTRNYLAEWLENRRHRVTGTTGYGLFTYCQGNHDPEDWKKKIVSFITPKDFTTEATEYGKKNEAPAREVFKQLNPNLEVFKLALSYVKNYHGFIVLLMA